MADDNTIRPDEQRLVDGVELLRKTEGQIEPDPVPGRLTVAHADYPGTGNEVVLMVPAEADTWRLASYQGGRVEVLHEQLPSDWAMGIGEDRAKAFGKLSERKADWLRRPPTDLQLSRLVREGLPESKLGRVHTRGDAADLLTRIQGRRAMAKLIG